MKYLAAIAVAAIRPALYGGWFCKDDWHFLAEAASVVETPAMRAWHRPLTQLVYWEGMWAAFGLEWWAYVVSRILVSAAIGLACYKLIEHFRPEGKFKLVGLLAPLLPPFWFTAYIGCGIEELGGAAFGLWALYFAIKHRPWLALLLYAGALLSKESAILWPVVFAWAWRNQMGQRETMVVALAFLLMGLDIYITKTTFTGPGYVNSVANVIPHIPLYGYWAVAPWARRLADPGTTWVAVAGVFVWINAIVWRRGPTVLPLAALLSIVPAASLEAHHYPQYAAMASCLLLVAAGVSLPGGFRAIALAILLACSWGDMQRQVRMERLPRAAAIGRAVFAGQIDPSSSPARWAWMNEAGHKFVLWRLRMEGKNE